MSRLTSIELADDMGTLVGTSVHGTTVTVDAIERLDREAVPGMGGFTRALEQARGMLDLPRRARVVLWDSRTTPPGETAPAVQPLTAAGFHVERVVSPCDALAALGRTRRPRFDATLLWAAVNRSHVAMVVMQPGRLFYSHSFAWDSRVGAFGSHSTLLQRYSLVAFLAPELRRAMRAAKTEDADVDGIITCGDLPELRSLTMPLIEELDVEVETLDSADGMKIAPPVWESAAELAPAIRLAVAGAMARNPRPRKTWVRVHAGSVGGIATAAALSAGGVWWQTHPSAPAPAREIPPLVRTPADIRLPAPPDPQAANGAEETPAGSLSSVSPAGLPQVSAILTSPDRRIALVDGRIVKVGDAVGRWRVTEIEPGYVAFTDGAGADLRIRLGSR
jgi:hypothetical protein